VTDSPSRALSKIVAATFFGAKIREAMSQSVIGQPATLGMEKPVALFQRGDEGGKSRLMSTLLAAASCFHPPVETGGLVHRERPVRPERGQHFCRMALGSEYAVMFQAVHRVVRGADGLDLEFFSGCPARSILAWRVFRWPASRFCRPSFHPTGQ